MKRILLSLIVLILMSSVVLGERVVFNHTGANQTFTVPSGVSQITVKLWGAGGGYDTESSAATSGGGAGFATGVLSVTPNENLTIIVGKGGAKDFLTTFGGGGAGGSPWGGSGGGRSAIRRASTELVTAAGGGGGGDSNCGGYGGGLTGGDAPSGGTGATQSAGGSINGVQFIGGNAGTAQAGGGGGGYYGGGGGPNQYYGGGGGSSYISGLSSASTERGHSYNLDSNSLAGGNTDPDYQTNIGVGASPTLATGGNGSVVLIYTIGVISNGQSCTVDGNCTSGNCDTDLNSSTKYCHATASSCVEYNLGSPWERANDYVSGTKKCVNSVWTTIKANGDSCTSDGECSSGNCDLDIGGVTKYCHATATSCVDYSLGSPWERTEGYDNGTKLCSNSQWTGSIDSDVVLLLHMDGADEGTTFTDSSSSAYTVNANNDVKLKNAQKKFGTTSAYFDGTTDYLTVNSAVPFTFSGDFTIDFWYYAISNSGDRTVIDARVSNGASAYALTLSGGTSFSWYTGSSYPVTTTQSTGVWNHWAWVREGSTVKLYKDGNLQGSTTLAGALTPSGSTPVIGGVTANYNWLDGYIDEFRISKVARWTSNFTPPSAAYGGTIYTIAKNLSSGIDLYTDSGSSVGNSTTATTLQIRNGTRKLIEFGINNTLNLSALFVDWAGSKTVVSNLGTAPGVTGTHSLYVDNTGSGIFICPSATTLAAITPSCAGVVSLACPGSSGQYSCAVDNGQYKVSGLTGSGIGEVCDHCDDCDSGLFCNVTAAIPTCENRTVHNPPECMDCLDNDADTYYDFLGYNTTESGDPDCASNLGASETTIGGAVPEFGTIALFLALGIVIAGVVMRRRA